MAKGGSVHTVSAQIAHMHVMAGNAEYVKGGATNRAVGVENSDSVPKKRTRKKWSLSILGIVHIQPDWNPANTQEWDNL